MHVPSFHDAGIAPLLVHSDNFSIKSMRFLPYHNVSLRPILFYLDEIARAVSINKCFPNSGGGLDL